MGFLEDRKKRITSSRRSNVEYAITDPSLWVCGKCRHIIEDHNDLYCRFCGHPTSARIDNPKTYITDGGLEGQYLPAYRLYNCSYCSNEYITHTMSRDDRHCPKCGNKIKAKIIDPPSLTMDSPSSEPLLDMAYKPDNH